MKFVKVGDVSLRYPYVEVFVNNASPFMDIGITDDRKIVFNIYNSGLKTELSIQQWELIFNQAKKFLQEALNDEDGFNDWMMEIGQND